MSRQEIIEQIEELIERMKWGGVQDASEYAYNQSIYAMESAVDHLKENWEGN